MFWFLSFEHQKKVWNSEINNRKDMRGSLLKAKGSLPLRAKITTDFINLVPVLWTVVLMKINKNNFFYIHDPLSYYFFTFFRAILSKCHRAIQKCNFVFLCVCPMKPNSFHVCFWLVWSATGTLGNAVVSCFHSFKNIEGNTTLCCYFWHTIWCCIQFINIYYIYSIFI